MPRVGWQAHRGDHRFHRSPAFYPGSYFFMRDDV